MRVLNKKGDEIHILLKPEENLRVGDCLSVGGIIVQVIDIEYPTTHGMLEHILRKSLMESTDTEEHMQREVQSILDQLSDHKLAITKIRGRLEDGVFKPGFAELNINRSDVLIELLDPERIIDMLRLQSKHMTTEWGEIESRRPAPFPFMLDKLGITLITGMKGSGKSYAAKKILLELVKMGRVVIVLDLNSEYINLWRNEKGGPNQYAGRIVVLDPKTTEACENRVPLRIPLHEISYDDFAAFTGIDRTTQMYNELIVFWERERSFSLDDLEEWAESIENRYVRAGLLGKIRAARAMNLFGESDIAGLIRQMERGGGAIVVNLTGVTRKEREVIVEFVLRRITALRRNGEIKPLCLFAEEAQLYATQVMWDDVLTRMRHYGIFPVFITNDPRTLPDDVFSLCDNIIAFKFQNWDDLKQIGRAKMIDLDTLNLLKNVENHRCLIIGDLTNDFPLLVKATPQSGVMMGGETQELFT